MTKKKEGTKATLQTLKDAYKEATEKGLESFKVEDYEFYTPFAKYLLQYLDSIQMPSSKPLKSFLKKTGDGNE